MGALRLKKMHEGIFHVVAADEVSFMQKVFQTLLEPWMERTAAFSITCLAAAGGNFSRIRLWCNAGVIDPRAPTGTALASTLALG